MMKHSIQFGIDQLLALAPVWKNKRIGFVTNNAAVTSSFISSRKALIQAGFNLVRLFSPEHGLDTTGPDGHFMLSGSDTLTGLPVVSLYGERLMPAEDDVKDLDVLLVDLPDIGSRFYTYLWTLTYTLEAAARYHKKLIVLDRPNPISGEMLLAEGPMLDEAMAASFIGRWSIPVRHSCTLGELARYFNAVRNLGADLEVINCEHWERQMFYTDWGTSFVPASPAINGFEAALLYPCLCFLEATNISEGRGTAVPFRVVGAPWMNATEMATLFNEHAGDAVVAREIDFVPESGRYLGRSCKGIMLHVMDIRRFRAVNTGLLIIKLIHDAYPQHFEWAPYKTHVNGKGENHLKLLLGQAHPETLFELELATFLKKLDEYTAVPEWEEKMKPYCIASYDHVR
ncbi:exo-beta-N-acetylmuramidase NamZ domain-containing protein [Chitinophaga sp. Hz27]|uniref:exo-beta-N-acetylmuramidase NamZ family protein n=1 Tax=Chitinophaga sp. Hz27 TaxID=3347169 RepID=UPI0035E054A4